jgi:hypothetical protein
LFYTTVHSVTIGQKGSKHVSVDVLKHYCNSQDMCAFVGPVETISKILPHGTKGLVLLRLIYTDEA